MWGRMRVGSSSVLEDEGDEGVEVSSGEGLFTSVGRSSGAGVVGRRDVRRV